jgi:hypothetical protein
MKRVKIVLAFLTVLLIVSCEDSIGNSTKSDIDDIAYFDFDGADYWVWAYSSSTKQDLIKHANSNSNPQKSVYHFYFDKSTKGLSKLGTDSFNLNTFAKTIVDLKPAYSFLKMNKAPIDEETALFMMELMAQE